MHCIDENWKPCSHVLNTSEITTEHSAENLADELQDILLRWNLSDDKLVVVTSDNACNIVNAIESVNCQHLAALPTQYSWVLKGSCRWLKYPKHLGVIAIWLPFSSF